MNTPIIAAKLYIPQPRAKLVRRPRLIERLNEGQDHKLTLISVSAGFGKTTLVSEWVSGCGQPVAWLSLDAGDSDSIRFFNHLIAALQTIKEDFGRGVVSVLNSQQPPSNEAILTILLHEITAHPHKFVLVFDDYHAIGSKWIDVALTFLLEHLPPQMHIVISTREDPQLPLSRLRARAQLNELRAADLRFTPDEAVLFLNQVMGLNLTSDEIITLESRTEGWITGLQLAALSMQGRQDVPAFIRAFAGDNRYIVDYLIEEVLERQPDRVRCFLLQTSILNQLHGPLCNAVTCQEDGNAQLISLERGNFFVVPLDDKRSWYRYHHLFAEVLSAHLKTDQPEQIAILHQRASKWFEQSGSAADAIRHALAAEDFARSAELMEREIPAIRKSRQEAAMLGWLRLLPEKMVQCRPVLSVGYAGMLLANGVLEGVEKLLRAAEQYLAIDRNERLEAPLAEMVVVNEEEFCRLPASIAMYRAGMAQLLGDIPNTMHYAWRMLELVTEGDHLTRGAATALLGLASWRAGDLETAHRMFADGLNSVQLAGAISDVINGSIGLAEIRIAQGQLRQAMRIYERGLQLALGHDEPEMLRTADMHIGMSELYCEFNELHTAANLLLENKELGERSGFPQNRFRWHVAMARVEEAQGNLDGALELLNEAERLYMSDFFPNVRPVAALKVRVRALQGRLGEALDWAREQGLSIHDELSYLREFEHITLAKVLLAKYKKDHEGRILIEAIGFLDRLLQAAEEGKRAGSVIEILVLQALACQMQDDIPAALSHLERALALAEPEGYVRIFADEGQPMAALAKAAGKQGIHPNYIQQILAVISKEDNTTIQNSQVLQEAVKDPPDKPWSEPLSERERDVLRLLGTDLSGPDIARQLMVSLNTLRTHTKNIYDKLGVNSRRAAVRKGEESKLN